MARAVAKYVFAALVALLSTQAAVPSARVLATIEIVCCAEQVRQQAPAEALRGRPESPVPPAPPEYVSRTRPEPEGDVLFQRPPPESSLLS